MREDFTEDIIHFFLKIMTLGILKNGRKNRVPKDNMQTQRYEETSYVFQGTEAQRKGSKEDVTRKLEIHPQSNN